MAFSPFCGIGRGGYWGDGMQIALYEKQHQYAEYVTRLLRKIESISQATVVYYSDADFIISDVAQRIESFDIAILCQQSESHDEIYIGRAISKLNSLCQIVFISRSSKLNPAYYEIPHLFTLYVDHVPQYMNMVVRQAIVHLENMDRDQLLVTTNAEKRFIPCREVLYLEHILRKTKIVTAGGVMETYQSPQELIQYDGHGRFIQCHKGFFVNRGKIIGLRSGEILLMGGVTVPIGRIYLKDVKAAFSTLTKMAGFHE